MRQQEWYSQGLRFECTQCGNCCTGPPGAVWFSEREAIAMAERFELTVIEFRHTYARKLDEGWSLNEVHTAQGFDCIFLDRQSMPGKAVCSIYEVRPSQCRTWPFWPENLKSSQQWEAVKRRMPCPGMNTGTLIPIDQIRIQRDGR